MNAPGLRGAGSSAAVATEGSLEVALAHVLQVGTYVSIGLVALGSLLLVASGGSPVAGGPPLDPATIVADLLTLRPSGFLWLGIVGVLATPGVRVLRAMLGFARRGEQRMAVISVLVVAVIALGVLVGVMAG